MDALHTRYSLVALATFTELSARSARRRIDRDRCSTQSPMTTLVRSFNDFISSKRLSSAVAIVPPQKPRYDEQRIRLQSFTQAKNESEELRRVCVSRNASDNQSVRKSSCPEGTTLSARVRDSRSGRHVKFGHGRQQRFSYASKCLTRPAAEIACIQFKLRC